MSECKHDFAVWQGKYLCLECGKTKEKLNHEKEVADLLTENERLKGQLREMARTVSDCWDNNGICVHCGQKYLFTSENGHHPLCKTIEAESILKELEN